MDATELDAAVYVLSQFNTIYEFALAAQNLGEVEFDDRTTVIQIMAAGGSVALSIRDFRRANRLLANLKEKYPDAPCWTSERGLLPDPVLGGEPYTQKAGSEGSL